MAGAYPQVLDRIHYQAQVKEFLRASLLENRLDHAYLFAGAPGSGKLEAAYAFASGIICPSGGDGTCDECIRVSHRTHPDVRLFEPASVQGYLVSQVHEIIDEVALAPIRAKKKVYIINRAELLRGSSANALLKTIEEPPANVVFILLARNLDSCLPTIVSRCQQVPFRIVSPQDALKSLTQQTTASPANAAIALAVSGSAERARSYLNSPERQEVRRLVAHSFFELEADDGWDVLQAASRIMYAIQQQLGFYRSDKAQTKRVTRDKIIKEQVSQRIEGIEEYYSDAALKQLEQMLKRELSLKERLAFTEAISALQSLLRDCIILCENIEESLVNGDYSQPLSRLAQNVRTEQVLQCLDASDKALRDISHNVSPQLVLEVMLLSIKEALTCPPSSQ